MPHEETKINGCCLKINELFTNSFQCSYYHTGEYCVITHQENAQNFFSSFKTNTMIHVTHCAIYITMTQ